ncbi:MAG TPA: RNA polymerase sigma factor [Candidatus Methylomirabilis sp.]|nr:RNA polymerase sigma factor [Candidatus Methylomirabilis sp.]
MDDIKELITEQIPRLRRYAHALTGNRVRADDLVQDTLERSWSRRHLWRRGSDLRAWLFAIMHNVFVNQLRKNSAAPGHVPFDEVFDPPSGSSPDEALELRDLASALERLPTEYREVLLLVGLEQMRYEDVAEILGVPLGTVMSRLSRGRDRLRALLSGQPPVLRRIK